MFTTNLFVRRQPPCLSTDEKIQIFPLNGRSFKLECSSMEHSSKIKSNKEVIKVTTWMNLRFIILHESIQIKKEYILLSVDLYKISFKCNSADRKQIGRQLLRMRMERNKIPKEESFWEWCNLPVFLLW